ncbi:mechanosensitive ion channel family protein [Rheinheimera baltica]|uniref:Small-conductance mechanosensitive channel n=1 Tax=Rheinheimera baltica TaxID=67576 RepID=A0ABT9HV43_9GAMM|nr:mechanosensitive ion channel family protein [Rheinheimera baltica]MDP5134981.1 mechanosensitive ion channel family protein [Rheinheimera baltica]MDP5149556.1 mechanosensitive ion channel family protein [Rheinheimera baltica]MDP5188713.1 mechanosensitive ion channel family protein [Rheinheimera baltica]
MTEQFLQWLQTEHISQMLKAAILLLVGFVVASLASRAVNRFFSKNFSQHHIVLFRKLVYWLLLALFVASALKQLGFSLSVLLGAAGVLSVALGFASQTSASNLISGLFLIGEQPFKLGDTIKVGNTTGEVLSIDLLSVKLRTFDNLFVRIPNETLIKSEVTNLTRFPIRRFDLLLGVAYKEQISEVRSVLLDVADKNPLCLDEPSPMFLFLGFGDSALNIQFSVWGKRENFRDLRNSLHEEVKLAFDTAGIDIPFPQRTVHLAPQYVQSKAQSAAPLQKDDNHAL